jgi:hypothetical protein
VDVAIRHRPARVAVLQDILNRTLRVVEARALEYAYHPGGATGMLVKDYRGVNAEIEIWKFDRALMSKINATLKQAGIEEGQWNQKREPSGGMSIHEKMARLNAGRDRVARAAEAKRAALAAAEAGPPISPSSPSSPPPA